MWLSLLLLDDAGLAPSSEARGEVLKAPQPHTIWSKPLLFTDEGMTLERLAVPPPYGLQGLMENQGLVSLPEPKWNGPSW